MLSRKKGICPTKSEIENLNLADKTEKGEMDFIPLSRAELQSLPTIYPTLFDVCHFILAAIAVRSIFYEATLK